MKIRERNIAMKNKMQVMMRVNRDDGQTHEEIEIKKKCQQVYRKKNENLNE